MCCYRCAGEARQNARPCGRATDGRSRGRHAQARKVFQVVAATRNQDWFTFDRRASCVASVVAGALAFAITAQTSDLSAEPFKPVRELTSWYTDRTPIDIEIVGSSSMLPQFHHLEPERTLRFRLERAYVGILLTEDEPGFEIVHFSFDMETGLPELLFFAVANKRRFHEDIAGAAVLPFAEQVRRTLNISLSSDVSAAVLQHASEVYRQKCLGAPVGDGLWIFQWKDRLEYCERVVYPNGVAYLADYDGMLLRIVCQEERFPGTGCTLHFPFKGFAVELSFHRDHVQDWRVMIDRASEFLLSKEYR